MNSDMSEMPGPLVAVKARAPFQPAPVTIPMEASSSSAWMIANLFLPVSLSTLNLRQYLEKASARDDEGVIGYHAHTVAPPYTAPKAAAALPSMKMRSPTVSALRMRKPIGYSTLADISLSRPLNSSASSCSTAGTSMSSNASNEPRPMMFLNNWR